MAALSIGFLGVLLSGAPRELSAAEGTAADALFTKGRKLMAEGRIAEACTSFEQSNELDPATGTLLNLAVCNESLGRAATASEQFRAAEAAATKDGRLDRVEFAREHLARLTPRLSYVTLVVRTASRPPGLKILLDGRPVAEASWNIALPIDAGTHTVVAEAPGVEPRSSVAQIGPSDVSAVVVVLGSVDAAPSAAVTSDHGPQPLTPGRSPLRTWAIASGGLGAASIGVGAFFGIRAFSKWDERNRRCPMDLCVTESGKRAQRSAEGAARNANITTGAGLVLLAAGVGLYLLANDGEQPPGPIEAGWLLTPRVSPDRLDISAKGHW